MYPNHHYYTAKVRLYPNADQQAQIMRTLNGCAIVRDRYHAKWQELYEAATDKVAFYKKCMDGSVFATLRTDYNKWKQQEPLLHGCDEWGLYNTFCFVCKVWKRFADKAITSGEAAELPCGKVDADEPQSYRAGRSTVRLLGNTVMLHTLGRVECSTSDETREILTDATNSGKEPTVVTVTRNPSGAYYASLTYTGLTFPNVKLPVSAGIERVVGIDVGLHDAIVTSYGEKFPNPHHRYQADDQLRKLRQQLSRYTPGSRNYEKTRTRIAKLQEHVENQRADFIHKVTNDLVMNFDIICIESLDARDMLKQNHLLCVSMGDAGWYEFFRQLDYKSRLYGNTIIHVPLDYPSSQICSHCGARWSGTKDLGIREWTCPECGAVHDRDINAAKNILREGLRRYNTVA